MTVQQIDVNTAKQWLDQHQAVLIDVREPAEHAAQKIKGAKLYPGGYIGGSEVAQVDKKILIHCQKGRRGRQVCQKLISENEALDIYHVDGGIEAWQQAGLPVENSGKKLLPLDRQMQITIGLSVFIFSLLGYFVSPVYALGAAFFGAGLVNAGLTGWCGLAKIIAKMPWNQA